MKKPILGILTASLALAIVGPIAAKQVLTLKTQSKAAQESTSERPMLLAPTSQGLADIKSLASEAEKPLDVPSPSCGISKFEADDIYYNDFSDEGASMEIIDANENGKTWTYFEAKGCMRVAYDSSKDMDDWMISPGIQLEAGKLYPVSIDAWAHSASYAEKIEVRYGKTRDVAGMTTVVIPATKLTTTSATVLTDLMAISESGTYYIGVHAVSDKDTYYVYADNLRVGAGQDGNIPARVVDFVVVPQGTDGTAVVKCKAPSTNMVGGALSPITKIEFWRDVTPIKTIENPSLGQEISFVDECGAGRYTWKAVVYNASGQSPEATFTTAVIGPKGVPFLKTFPTLESLDEMTIVDANQDGSTWGWDQYQKYAKLSAPQTGDNDWIITPPLILKAGKVYEYSSLISAGNPNAFPPMVRICVGNAPTAEAMTQEIVPKTTITKYDTYFTQEFTVPTDGLWHVGVQGCSEKYLALIKLMNINVIGGAEVNGPAKVSNAVVEPDWSGRTRNVSVSFTAPTKTGADEALTSMTKIEVMRQGIVVHTFENPTPGANYSWTDKVSSDGEYTYRIVPYNTVGQGGVTETVIKVGIPGKAVPYLEDFKSADRFDNELFFFDNNNDGTNFWHATMTNPPYAWCHYNGKATDASDDYLVTPGINLVEGTRYRISADAWGHNEGFRILVGTAPKLDSLTNEIVPLTKITEFLTNYGGEFLAPYTGKFYVGVHDFTPAGERMEDFHVTNIRVDKIGLLTAPAQVDNFTVIADPNGEPKMTFKFNAPTKNLDGTTLSAIDSIVLKRGNAIINVFPAPAPGAALQYEDNPGTVGEYNYEVFAVSEAGEGAPLTYLGYAGLDLPAIPQNVVATDIGGGKVKVTWDPVTTTAHGAQIPTTPIYVILESDGQSENQLGQTTMTEYTYKALPEGETQHRFTYYIYPFNSASEHADPGISNDVFVGEPFTLAYLESFENGAVKTPFVIQNRVFSPTWSLCTDESFSDVKCSDGDNGFLAQKGFINHEGIFYTGVIDLNNTVSPTFSFYAYNINPSDYNNFVTVEIKEAGTDTWTKLGKIRVREAVAQKGWGRISVDLGAWKGKKVHVGIVPSVQYTDETGGSYYSWTIVDGFRVHNLTNKDLGANLSVSDQVIDAGEEIQLTVTVSNNGEQAVGSYSVDLYKNGKVIDQLNGSSLASGRIEKLVFPQDISVADNDEVEFYAVVNLAGDENTIDNTSKKITVKVNKPIYPTTGVLQASERQGQRGTVDLQWSAPNMETVPPAPYTETFESASGPSFTGACDWTFVDVDDAPIGGFQQFNFPQLNSDGTSKASFFVVDKTASELGQYASLFGGYNGSIKSIGSLLSWGGTPDDWAISPVLYGGAQVVSFYGKNLQDNMPEKVELWYSTGSTNPADFIFVKEWSLTSAAWEKCSAYLPVGAKRVAIRHNFQGGILQVDNIEFRRAGDPGETVTLKGYNVYRNGEKLNDELVAQPKYTDNAVPAGLHQYAVNAVYDKGQSNVQTTNLQVVSVGELTNNNVLVDGGEGIINIYNAMGCTVSVYTLDGKAVYNGAGKDRMTIPAATGVYLVKAGENAFKVVVK